MERIYQIKLDNGASYQVRGDEALELKLHDECVVRKDFYLDYGTIASIGSALEEGRGAEMPQIIRLVDSQDQTAIEENRERCHGAMRSAKMLVDQLGLTMKLLNAHYSLDGKLLTIQFTADGRVDFRELVKELSRAMGTRIELRQIGVRDESAIHGGISICGQVLCCCRFLNEFNSINVRMAKDQDLSLTPGTISGICGRLKCCLKFEHEGYMELEKTMPRRGEWCDCPAGRGKITDRNLLTQEVTVTLISGGTVRCSREEITICPPERRTAASGNAPEQGAPAENNNAKSSGKSAPRNRNNNNNNNNNAPKQNGGKQNNRNKNHNNPKHNHNNSRPADGEKNQTQE